MRRDCAGKCHRLYSQRRHLSLSGSQLSHNLATQRETHCLLHTKATRAKHLQKTAFNDFVAPSTGKDEPKQRVLTNARAYKNKSMTNSDQTPFTIFLLINMHLLNKMPFSFPLSGLNT